MHFFLQTTVLIQRSAHSHSLKLTKIGANSYSENTLQLRKQRVCLAPQKWEIKNGLKKQESQTVQGANKKKW